MKSLKIFASVAIAAMIFGSSPSFATSALFSDAFTSDSALNAGWTLNQLNSASSYTLDSTGLTLTSSGTGSDLWPGTNYGASLLLQPVSSSANYTLTLKMAYNPQNFFSGAGLVLTTQTSGFSSSSAFLRYEYETNGPGNGVYVFGNGSAGPFQLTPAGAPDTWLRLQKQGDVYTLAYSLTGASWSSFATVNDTNSYTYVGLISDRWAYDGATRVPSAPDFVSFTATSAVPEPATWAMMLLGFAGLGIAGWRGTKSASTLAA